ncbi:MAG TPA: transcription/translation regulatory transformer protein RfaH [Vibrio sp.]|uniref:transcription/translation regulatory transformer protein RfaH n=1 Tax=Vibrio TaxID=662 RepID=UPI000EE95015|nr:transcription/translation regulatory transformer protein RfaH [Vibrio sp.]HCH01673.1 transcription/translation regulatory transformer protein RfaH [Vibrio sp.]
MKEWYLLYCKRGEQKRASAHLENQHVECYYPEIELEKVLRGKRQRVQEPLFPSYIFIAIEPEKGPSFTTIRSTRGVVDFVRFGAQPYKVPKSLIEHLQSHQIDEADYTNTPKSGQTVHITSGQFSGFDAIYQEADGEKRSILLITLINQKVKIKVENTDVDW